MIKLNIFNKLNNYITHEIWDTDIQKMFVLKRIFIYGLRTVYLVSDGLIRNKCAVWTNSLSFTTILSLVPFLAVFFYFIQWAGTKSEGFKIFLHSYIRENLTMGSEQIANYLIQFSQNIQLGALGYSGLIFLMLTIISLLSTIERAFNNIWGIQNTRPFFVRVCVYWTIVSVSPFLIGLSYSLSLSFQFETIIKRIDHITWINKTVIFILPYILSSMALTAIYKFMPNTKVRLRSALMGGIIGGCLWEGSKSAFYFMTKNVFSYHEVYGAMAAFPVFLIWIYISWLVVLIGAEIVFADQHLKSYGKEKKVEEVHFAFKEYLALHIVRYMGRLFYEGKEPVSVDVISSDLGMPVRLVNEVAHDLAVANIIKETSPDEGVYQIARPLEKISVQSVLDALCKKGISLEMAETEESVYLKSFIERLEIETRKITSNTSFLDIVKLSETIASRKKKTA
ncbi:MAG TPA: YhjD/YihY/BrkB family envelope integrity protein [Bdellovibrionota bacterium]|nr:YhjD/YihY/BrkB family envelope integrity protein [Bdellovibrionota bacterium]